MRPSAAIESEANRALIRRVVAARRGRNPRVFGSVLDGTDQEGSDLDLLVDRAPGMGLFDLIDIEDELTDALGVSADVKTPGFLSERFRAQIVEAARPV